MSRHLKKTGCIVTGLILCVVLLTNAASAQAPRTAANESGTTGRTRPDPLATEVSISPELEMLLQTWEKKSSEVNRMKGEFQRIVYDKVFESAHCANGRYFYEAPDKGRMDLSPDASVVSNPPRQVTKQNITYTQQADEPHTWICDGQQILDIDISKKQYNRVQIPAHYQGKNITSSPLPFLFGMKSDKMKERYILEIGGFHDQAKVIHIVAFPKLQSEQREYRVAEVLLDPVEFMPRAVQLTDPTGNKQTVYMFTRHDKVSIPWLPPGPFNPPLFGLKLIHDEEAPPPLEREGNRDGILIR
jgi:TIGR03009 family protein